MATTYNPYSDIEAVYNAKVNYGNATTDEERKRQNEIANAARKNLEAYGYSDVANQISASGANADTVRDILNKYSAEGKVATRDHLYSRGSGYGMSQSDVDNAIGWNQDSGEVSIGGKVVGKPDATYNGKSYWGDTSALDQAFTDYAHQWLTTNKTPTRDYLYSLGAGKGMSQEEVDKLIGWKQDTGEVTFDGRTIGKPSVSADGKSYWDNTTALDSAFNEYYDRRSRTGKTATRDYLYSLGASRGMSKEEVDKLIGWDNETGEVIFGGKKIGKPDWVSNGVSYWADTSVLDNAFNDWAKRSGHTIDKGTLKDQNDTGVKDKIEQLWGLETDDRNAMSSKYNKLEETAYSNPFITDEAKAILAKYDLAGLQGRDNAVASGGASNGGNIDSYAASNAMRQQASLINQGQMAVLEAHNNRINNVKGILESLGVYQQNQDASMRETIGLQQSEAQRLFENEETAKNNETARLEVQANVSGYTPTEWAIKNDDVYSTYLNPDGTFKKEMENVDIQALINSAKANGDTETAQKLAVVRGKKILSNYGVYGQWANSGDISYMKGERTANYDLTDKQIKSAEKIAEAGNETKLTLAEKEIEANLTLEEKKAQHAMEQLMAQIAAGAYGGKDTLDAYDVMMNIFEPEDNGPRMFIQEKIKPMIESGEVIDSNSLFNLLVNDENSKKYNIDVADAKKILHAMKFYEYDEILDDNYEDVEDDPSTDENEAWHGMKKK